MSVNFANGQTYSPGVKQHLQVVITDSSQKRWGFELTARLASSSTSPAGTFTPGSDGYTQLLCATSNLRSQQRGTTCSNSTTYPLQYIAQTLSGTRSGTSSPVTYDFDWTPPANSTGSINIYVAGNAANGNNNETGDHIYTNHYTLTPAAGNGGSKPTVSAVANGAGFQQTFAAGSWVTISGTNLANSTRPWGSADLANGLPTSLDGVSVTIDNKPAYVAYVSPTQLNVLAPADTATGSVSVVVTNNSVVSDTATATLLPESPALFLWSGKYAVATRQDYTLVGPTSLFAGSTTPAKPGDVVILWGTGFGVTTPSTIGGQLTPSSTLYSVVNPPAVTIGGVSATVYAAALAPGFAGLYQLAVQIPTTLSSGDQPVVLQSNGVQSPAGVYITVQ